MVSYIIVQQMPDRYKGTMTYHTGLGLTVRAQMKIPLCYNFSYLSCKLRRGLLGDVLRIALPVDKVQIWGGS